MVSKEEKDRELFELSWRTTIAKISASEFKMKHLKNLNVQKCEVGINNNNNNGNNIPYINY